MTNEMKSIKELFSNLPRNQKLIIIQQSNLNDREVNLLIMRLVQGNSLKDCAEIMNIEEDSVNKAQLKAVKKLYTFLVKYAQIN